MLSRPLVPQPPARNYPHVSQESDLHSLLAQRAKRMLAAGTAPPRHQAEPAAGNIRACDSVGAPSASLRKPQRPNGYPLEWDPRAVPLLAFAEEERRRALLRQEAEHWLGLLGAVHINRVEAYFSCRLREIESQEEHEERRAIVLKERDGRQVLWSAHEELIVAVQLREIDLPKEEAMALYLHHASSSSSSSTAFAPLVSDPRGDTASSVKSVSKCEVPSASKDSHKNEWILGIVYLITFDLNLQERKDRIAMLREEYAERQHLGVLRETHSLISVKSYSDRRHRERCQAYREARARQWSLDLLDEYFVNPMWEEWIQLTGTLIAATLLDEHRLFLRGMSAAALVCHQRDDRSRFICNEEWHRAMDLEAEWSSEVVRISAHHYFYLALAIEEEERRVWTSFFAPWIASARSLRHATDLRLHAALRIQVFVRKVRQGLKGWRVTHRIIAGLIRSKRNREERVRIKERHGQQWLARLGELERQGSAEDSRGAVERTTPPLV